MTPAQPALEETGIVPRLRTAVVAGAAAGNVTVTGIRVSDKLSSVIAFQVGAAVGIDSVADLTSEFAITASNTINNTGGTASTNGWLQIIYFDDPNAR